MQSLANKLAHPLAELILRALIVIAALAFIWSASSARAAFLPDHKPNPHATRSGSDESPETRFALMEREQRDVRERLSVLERQLIEQSRDITRLDRTLVGLQAVAAANTQANWIVGGGFVAQFLFSLLRYLKFQIPNGRSKEPRS